TRDFEELAEIAEPLDPWFESYAQLVWQVFELEPADIDAHSLLVIDAKAVKIGLRLFRQYRLARHPRPKQIRSGS
ncbi:MAG: hypothetical protein JOZ83_03855, partial [Silvibacterium sp.]|nr:hypothetical protein [Silvibacterium sp.]